jgi:cellulose synthase/poly-beta-1,6-N-acetylglucosamine synthase-like glycosyltransferase
MPKKALEKRSSKIVYLLFILPIILAFLCWLYFPALAYFLSVHVFGYVPNLQPTHWLWHGTLYVFFTLYTFLAIGLGGIRVVAAWIYKRRKGVGEGASYPSVTFVVPAYNEEKRISKCITSLFANASNYPGFCEIIVVDDGSTDYTYEIAWATIQKCRRRWPNIRCKVVRHCANLGKAEAIRTGVNRALGELIATVDADTWWEPNALKELVKMAEGAGHFAISGYIHPTDGEDKRRLYITLQQLEYSQGLGIYRSAQALGNSITVVPGPMGLYRADALREILNGKTIKSVAEDMEITLEMQKKKLPIGYADEARSATVAPQTFKAFWNQRLRWFTGGIHNMLSIHRDLLFKKRLLSLFLWDALILGYGCSLIEIAALLSLPIFLWFAPDKIFFILNLLIYAILAFLVGIIHQAIALKFSYGKYNHKRLLMYTPLYSILRMINVSARIRSLIKFLMGDKGCWHKHSQLDENIS